jgi:hypothetical protein
LALQDQKGMLVSAEWCCVVWVDLFHWMDAHCPKG